MAEATQLSTPIVVSEDDELLVVDKPGGLVCHSASRDGQPSLATWLRERGIKTPRMVNGLIAKRAGWSLSPKTNARQNRSAKKCCGARLKRNTWRFAGASLSRITAWWINRLG